MTFSFKKKNNQYSDDIVLLEDLKKRIPKAQEYFFILTYNYCKSFLKNRKNVLREKGNDDIFIEVFNDFLEDIDYKYIGKKPLKAVVSDIVRYRWIDAYRKENKYERINIEDINREEYPSINFEDPFEKNIEYDELLKRALLELSPDDNYFFELIYRKNLTPKEIAKLLNIHERSVSTKKGRLKSVLKQIINKYLNGE